MEIVALVTLFSRPCFCCFTIFFSDAGYCMTGPMTEASFCRNFVEKFETLLLNKTLYTSQFSFSTKHDRHER